MDVTCFPSMANGNESMNYFPHNMTDTGSLDTDHNSSLGMEDINPALDDMQYYLQKVVSPILCIFGIFGNILNMLVLTRRRLLTGMDSMERAAHLNLIALAVSDLLFCTCTLPRAFMPTTSATFPSRNFWMYYHMYGTCFQNIFSKTSTWLTLVMAVGRYAAICHPLRAREFVHVTCTRSAIVLTFIGWVLLHLPQFWSYTVSHFCVDGTVIYITDLGEFKNNKSLNSAFSYTWMIVGFFIPVPLLAYCNACLIRALKESNQMRRQYRVHTKKSRPGNKITPTLIIIVIMFFVLVAPSEIIHFVIDHVSTSKTQGLSATIVFFNVLQTVNFASNFVLYCAVNVHFRKTLKDLIFICRRPGKSRRTPSWMNQSSKSFITVLSETQM